MFDPISIAIYISLALAAIAVVAITIDAIVDGTKDWEATKGSTIAITEDEAADISERLRAKLHQKKIAEGKTKIAAALHYNEAIGKLHDNRTFVSDEIDGEFERAGLVVIRQGPA